VAALLPGAQHREDRDPGAANGLKASRGRLRHAMRIDARRAFEVQCRRIDTPHQTMNRLFIPTRIDAELGVGNRVKAQSR
jgi:hypothetical protein